MAGSAILSIKILTDASKAQAGLKDAEKSSTGFASKLSKGSVIAAGALAAVGAAAVGAAKAAAEDEQAQAILANTLHKAAGATDAQVAATEDWISKTAAATGVADDQLRPALASLVRATGDVTKSQDAMGVALDVSAATGQDVESVSKALAKGYAGNTKALGKLVPGMDKAVLASGDMSQVMAELQRTTGGAAAAAADTAAGKWQRFQLAMSETKESAGAALLPALTALSGVLLTVGNLAQEHSTAFVILAAAIAGIAVAIMAANAAITIYNTVTTIAGIVSKTAWLSALGPIALVIAAVLAVVAVIVILWKKSETFRNIVLGVWAAIKTAFAAVVGFIKANWMTLIAVLTGPIGIAVLLIVRNWNTIKSAASAVISWIKSAWNTLWGGLKSAASAAAGVISRAWDGIKSAVSALASPFRTVEGAINAVVGAVQSLISWLGRIHIPKISLPKIPGFNASSAAAPTVSAGIGGGGFRAAAVPSTRAVTSTAGGIVINVSGAIDPEATARQIRRILSAHDRRVGLTGALRTGTV